jgi:phospholipid-translocating ATPase
MKKKGEMKKKDSETFSVREIELNKEQKGYPQNIVRNQKYTWITFIPLVIMYQFRQFISIYFFLISASQLIPAYTVSPPISNVAPWCLVLFLTLLKEGIDDWKRYIRDKEANSQLYKKLTPSGVHTVPSSSLRVGDIILLEKNQRIPADSVLLKTVDAAGHVFVRTDQLDGETDWKLRVAVPSIQALPSFESVFNHDIKIYADKPHKDIYSFIGKLTKKNGLGRETVEPLTLENVLWMSTVLASGHAMCSVIYTGEETRAMMNTMKPKNKCGLIERELNGYSIFLSTLSILAAFFFTFMRGFTTRSDITFIRFMVIFSSVIPISLKVSIDCARQVYARWIMQDKNIEGCIVRTSNIPEELGRISYFLTDKTGTLTTNEMEMKKVHLGTICYTEDLNSELSSILRKVLEKRKAHEGSGFSKGKKDIGSRIYDLLQGLSICHNVTPVYEEGGLAYQASSPDEVAIVRWTEKIGMKLHGRDRERMVIVDLLDDAHGYDILHVFPFTSETKRMGIIVRNIDTGEIGFYMKGADVVMKDIVKSNDWLNEETDNMAREGLRTLVIGKKALSEEELSQFDSEYKEAKMSITNRAEEMQRVVSRLESNLSILGLTGVEDRLQEGVKLALENLRSAGIKIWMLTGDKIETATCIAISSRLFLRTNVYSVIENLQTREEGWERLNILKMGGEECIVIDGKSIQIMIDHFIEEFMGIASKLDAVVCCRCSPTQKATIARMLKKYTNKRVCCIGDGGNDVSMITEADVGIGIVGKEGNQASLAADYSLTKFNHVCELFLWHGRNCYRGTAKLAHFIIHRGTIISVMQAIFCSLFLFSPISLYQGPIIVGYVTLYTFFPVFSLILSRDVTRDVAMKFPELYRDLLKGRALNFKAFSTWNVVSFYQGAIIMLLSFVIFEKELYSIISITFSSLIINELLMVTLSISSVNKYMLVAEGLSLFFYILSFVVLPDELIMPCAVGEFVVKVIGINVVAICFSVIQKIWRLWISPSSYSKL